MINSQDVKNGICIRMDGRLYFVIEFLHVKPGKGNTIMRVKFKDVVDGRVLERRFNIGEKLEDVRVERRPYQYLYQEGEDYIFMNNETFETDGSVHRAGSERRYRYEHPEACYAGNGRRGTRSALHQRRRNHPR